MTPKRKHSLIGWGLAVWIVVVMGTAYWFHEPINALKERFANAVRTIGR